jgi:hypothetical protein
MKNIREQILAKLAEVDELLMEAECNGEQLAELDCFSEVEGALNTLSQTVDYYID